MLLNIWKQHRCWCKVYEMKHNLVKASSAFHFHLHVFLFLFSFTFTWCKVCEKKQILLKASSSPFSLFTFTLILFSAPLFPFSFHFFILTNTLYSFHFSSFFHLLLLDAKCEKRGTICWKLPAPLSSFSFHWQWPTAFRLVERQEKKIFAQVYF